MVLSLSCPVQIVLANLVIIHQFPVIILIKFSTNRLVIRVFFTMNGNVLALGAVADFGAPNCQYTTKVDTW